MYENKEFMHQVGKKKKTIISEQSVGSGLESPYTKARRVHSFSMEERPSDMKESQ